MARPLKIYFDGGCRPNPGLMEGAVVARGQAVLHDFGPGSSFDAEWCALIAATKHAVALGVIDYVLLGDAATVVAQANGSAPCRGSAVGHRAALLEATGGTVPRVRYVKRAQNLAGIALARRRDR